MQIKNFKDVVRVHSEHELVRLTIKNTVEKIKILFPNYSIGFPQNSKGMFLFHNEGQEIRFVTHVLGWSIDTESGDECFLVNVLLSDIGGCGGENEIEIPVSFIFMSDEELNEALNLYRERYKTHKEALALTVNK